MNWLFLMWGGWFAGPPVRNWTCSAAGREFGLLEYTDAAYLVLMDQPILIPGDLMHWAIAAILLPVAVIGVGVSARQLG